MAVQRGERGPAGAALGLLLCLAAAAAGAQATQADRPGRLGQAVLERGPSPSRGIPFFPPNVLPAYRGEYLAEESRVVVYFTREPLVLPSGWRRVACGQDTLLRLDGEEEPTFCYPQTGDEGYVLFFAFASESFPWCAWTQAFLQRLRYLLSFTKSLSEVSFPAVFEYRKSERS